MRISDWSSDVCSSDLDGAFYIYADVSHLTNDSFAFCEALLRDTGVAIAPGLDFDPVDGKGFIRLSSAVSTELLEEATRRIELGLVGIEVIGPAATLGKCASCQAIRGTSAAIIYAHGDLNALRALHHWDLPSEHSQRSRG